MTVALEIRTFDYGHSTTGSAIRLTLLEINIENATKFNGRSRKNLTLCQKCTLQEHGSTRKRKKNCRHYHLMNTSEISYICFTVLKNIRSLATIYYNLRIQNRKK